ncbi:MAG TPA: PAS domain S-box protein [Pyrinomonadaceae bacterium]|jgi:PAS domain S-box-containing protein|nr:PAS domain S-box protein [Pyrinomonadaceae bacterium]
MSRKSSEAKTPPTVTDNHFRNLQSPELAPFWLAAIIESADDAIISKTLDGIITSWNTGAHRIFGYTANEVIGKSVTILIPPGHEDEEPSILARLRAGKRIEHYETVRVTKDGRLIDISLTVSPIKAANGEIIGASKIARDITEQRQARHALDEASTRLRLALEAARLGDWSWEMKTDVVTLSETAARIFGIPPGRQMTWTGLRGLLHSDDREPARLVVEQALASKTDYDIEYRVMRDNNSVVWVSAKGRGIYDDDGTVTGMLGFVQDISARKTNEETLRQQAEALLTLNDTAQTARAEAEYAAAQNERLYRQAEESSRLKEEFLATISHELRTPLSAILGWTRMLRMGQLSPENSAKALDTIERNARAQSQLVDDLLDVSRIITGKLRMDVRPSDPNSFIDAAVEAVKPAADAKGVRIQKVVDTGAISIPGDPVRLQQVVWNLLSNAIKFTPRGGRVQIRSERVNSHLEIVVSDTGQGISPDFLPHVFDRFRQADQKTSRQHGGMGLGLAIVRHLVEMHGGSVRASSEGDGKGATFTVMLPIAPVYQVDSSGSRVHPAARDLLPADDITDRLDGLTILVVDDEPDTRELLKQGLEYCGAKVRVAGSAVEALNELKRELPDVLISDIGMPGSDGYHFIRQVRSLPVAGGGRIAAIALTAYTRVEDRLQALRAGYDMHVPKPVELAELVAVAASVVRRSA